MSSCLAPFAAAIALASCAEGRGPEPERAPHVTPTARAGATPPAAIADSAAVPDGAAIAGEWDVVSFEGYRPRRLSGTIRATRADFGEAGVALRLECNYSGRAGTVRDGRFVASPANDRMQTAMSCGDEANERERRYFTFFESGPTVERLGPGRLRLRQGDVELVLARPDVRRLDFVPAAGELQGRWRLLELTRYLPAGGHSGIGLSEVPGRIVISGDRLFYSRCAQYGIEFRLGTDGRLEKRSGTAPPAAPAGCGELDEPAPGPELPSQWDALRLLHAGPAVERSGDDSLLVSTGELGLLIRRAPCEGVEQSGDHSRSRIVDCASPE